MEEFRRQAYLKSMGIPVWLPRRQLSNAAPAFLLDYKPPDPVLAASPSAKVRQAAAHNVERIAVARVEAPRQEGGRESAVSMNSGLEPAQPQANTQALLKAIASPTQEKSRAVKSVTPSAEESTSTPREAVSRDKTKPKAPSGLQGVIATPPTFSLVMIRLNPDCLVVSECSLGEDGAVQGARDQLLLNMVRAAFKVDFNIERRDFCHWPLVKNPQVDQGPLVAQQAVAQLVATRCQSASSMRVMLMGKAAQTYASGFAVYVSDRANQPALITVQASLDDLLTEPSRKRDAWNEIKRCLDV